MPPHLKAGNCADKTFNRFFRRDAFGVCAFFAKTEKPSGCAVSLWLKGVMASFGVLLRFRGTLWCVQANSAVFPRTRSVQSVAGVREAIEV